MKIDLVKGVYIQIGGELGKYNSLPIDNFIRFAQDLQNTILDIAKYDLPSDQSIDLNNFKLEMIDFKKGSAVPQFAFTQRTQETLGNSLSLHRDFVSDRFEELLKIADEGQYGKLRELYPEPYKRNVFVENLYLLTNDFGNSPVTFSEYQPEKDNFIPIYKFKKFKPEIKKELTVEILDEVISIVSEDTAYAKIKIKSDKKGKMRNMITQLYKQKGISLNFAPDVILADDRKYILRFPLRCFFEKEEDYYIIHSEMLDIIGTGKTEDEAEKSFSEEFDYTYRRLNELEEEQLSAHLKMVKTIINQMIDKIESL